MKQQSSLFLHDLHEYTLFNKPNNFIDKNREIKRYERQAIYKID